MENNNQYNFWNAYSSGWKNYTNFQDKATRTQYWTFALVNSVISFILAMFSYPLALIFSLAEIIPGIAIGVRRIRDTGQSPANYCWIFLPIAGFIIIFVFFLLPSNHYLNQENNNDEEDEVEEESLVSVDKSDDKETKQIDNSDSETDENEEEDSTAVTLLKVLIFCVFFATAFYAFGVLLYFMF